MKREKLLALTCVIVIIAAIAIIYPQKPGVKMQREESIPGQYDSRDYKKSWQTVDSLTQKGLTRSVITVLDTLYEKAKNEHNAPQFVKTVIHKLKFESYIEEEAYAKAIGKVSEEIKTAPYPIKPILHSLLASIYWQYYTDNRWSFSERSKTVNFLAGDIRTWDIEQIIEQTIYHYRASIEDAGKLKKTPLGIYDEILTVTDKSLRKFRPTLYDFLAHRAIDFFMGEEPDIIRPAYKFEIDSKQYFASFDTFSKTAISSKDSLSLKLYALIILQDLVKFHAADKDPEALIDVDLKRLNYVHARSVVEEKESLYLAALLDLEKKFKSHASWSEIAYEIATVYYQKGQTYAPLVSDTNKWMLKKAHDICIDALEKTKQENFGSLCCKHLKSVIESKNLQFKVENVNVPDRRFRAAVSFKNLPKVYARIVRADPQEFTRGFQNHSHEEMIKKVLGLPVVKEWEIALFNDGDFQQHEAEVTIPALGSGFYVIVAASSRDFSYDKNAVAFSGFWVSNISYINRTNAISDIEYYILDRTTGKPLKNASAQVYYENYNYNARKYESQKGEKYATDANGYFKMTTGRDGRNYFISLTYKEDFLNTENAYSYRNPKAEEQKQLRTLFFTDRAIYRPGQTIYFKGIMLEALGDKTDIKPDYRTTVTFYDVNHQKVHELSLASNEYGTFSGTFTAPTGVLTGTMSITNTHGWHSFLVEEYKRPKFEVTADPIKGEFRLNDKITVYGTAKAYAGSVVDNAAVKYRVVRSTMFPYWWCWSPWFRPAEPEMEITSGDGKTDENGKYSVAFTAIPDKSVSKKGDPKFSYTVFVDVTDINGETHSAEHTVVIGYTALNLSVNIPLQLDNNTKENFTITATNLAGERAIASGKVVVHALQHPSRLIRPRLWTQPDLRLIPEKEFAESFPLDPWKDELNITTWGKGDKVLETAFNTETDTLLKIDKLNKWEPGQYVLEATSKDRFGEPVKDIKYFTVFSTTAKKVPVHGLDWFTLLQTKGEVGDTITLLAGSKAKDVSILYEIENRDKIVYKEWLSLTGEQKKISIPVIEDFRGNFSIHVTFVKESRCFRHDALITVPYTNKQLDIAFETFRDKLLPGQKEEWKVTIKGKKGEKAAAEMLASMYDASLDAFAAHNWFFDIYRSYYARYSWNTQHGFEIKWSTLYEKEWNSYFQIPFREYDVLNLFGYGIYQQSFSRRGGGYGGVDYAGGIGSAMSMDSEMPPAPSAAPSERKAAHAPKQKSERAKDGSAELEEATLAGAGGKPGSEKPKQGLEAVKARTNFNETAFFFPHLKTDKNGSIILSFTMPEALTRWKLLGLAHTKDLKTGLVQKEVVTQKDLMVMPNPPRFFRENDKITFSTKVSNISDKEVSGNAQLFLFDALTMEPADKALGNVQAVKPFTAKKGQSAAIAWDLAIPDGIQAITYKVVAKAGNFTDGEEMTLPVMTNRMLVTETMPLPIRGKQTKQYTLKKLTESGSSKTLKNHKLTLEYTANPAWYAIQALPYLMEYPYECAEQVFSRFYANSIASHIANASPRIKQVFDSWKNITPDALLSNLQKNQELKGLLLEETPWVLDAKDESQRKRNVALLFDLNKMADELGSALHKLQKLQASNGGWPWFAGMPDNRYITQHIVTGMGHLDHLGVKNIRTDDKTWNMITSAVYYLDDRMREDYEWLLKNYPDAMDKNHTGAIQIQYLYARSYFLKYIKVNANNEKAFDYYKGQAKKYWLENNRYLQGMIALSLHRLEDAKTPADIIKSLKENAMFSEEMGMYWNDISGGYYWHQAAIETMALLIEAFDEVAKDAKSVEDLKVWLIKNKQTNDWKTTKATTEACYALLLRGTDWLAKEPAIEITVGAVKVDPKKMPDVKVEAGTGYFKTSWQGSDIKPAMGSVTVKKGDEGVSWGALYWQYFEQLDKITPHETPMKLSKKLFIEKNSPSGPVIDPVTDKNKLKLGDKVKVRIELRIDRDMEYVHMKDMRAAGFEPINVISSYKYQDGLGYYESTRDASTNFFISFLPKGTYVFEYPLRVSHKGDFSNGITTIQCMYAPEFASHSEGIRVRVAE